MDKTKEENCQEVLLTRYKAGKGQQCYFCGSPDLDWGSGEFTVFEGEMESQQVVSCLQCGGGWLDVYVFERVVVARKG